MKHWFFYWWWKDFKGGLLKKLCPHVKTFPYRDSAYNWDECCNCGMQFNLVIQEDLR